MLAPNAKLRAASVPGTSAKLSEYAEEHTHRAHELGALTKGVFDIDIEHCLNWCGALQIIAAIEEPYPRARPRSSTRPLALFRAA